MELGDFLEKAEMENPAEDSNCIPLCYVIACRLAQDPQTSSSAEQKIMGFGSRTENIKKPKLIIPHSASDRDVAILFIGGLKNNTEKESCYAEYFAMARKFEAMAINDRTSLKEWGYKNLETALFCYEISRNAYVKNMLAGGIIEAKIQECNKILENIRK